MIRLDCVYAFMLAAALGAAGAPSARANAGLSSAFEQALGSARGFSGRIQPVAIIEPKPDPFLKRLNRAQRNLFARAVPAVVTVKAGPSLGSGFIVDPAGIALTNAHVVGTEKEVGLETSRGPVRAQVLAVAPGRDVAVLRIQDAFADWPALSMNEGAGLTEGDLVYSIGNPQGLGLSLNSGTVSRLKQDSLSPWVDYIQSDIQISQGNSGGPLLDQAGRLVGMNTAIAGTGGRLGLAVDARTLRRALAEFRSSGSLADGFTSVSIHAGTLMVVGAPKAETEQALRPGDVIAGYGGQPAPLEGQPMHLFRSVARKKPGDTLPMQVRRGVKAQFVVTTPAEASKPESSIKAEAVFNPSVGLVYIQPGPQNAEALSAVNARTVEEIELADGRRLPVVLEFGHPRREYLLLKVDPKAGWTPENVAEEYAGLVVEAMPPTAHDAP